MTEGNEEGRRIVDALDAAHAARSGHMVEPTAPDPEAVKAAEAAAMERANEAPEREAETARFVAVRSAIRGQFAGLAHGKVYPVAERKAMAARIVERLGDTSPKTAETVRAA